MGGGRGGGGVVCSNKVEYGKIRAFCVYAVFMSSYLIGRGHIVCGVDLVGFGTGFGVDFGIGMIFSCLHNIL